jgi:hypothetical protein
MTEEQLPLPFGFKDSQPHLKLKKIVTKERIEEMKKLYKAGKINSTCILLSDLNDKLENYEKRLKNK